MRAVLLAAITLIINQLAAAQTTTTTPTVTTKAPEAALPWTASLKSEMESNIETGKTVGGAQTDNQFRIAYKFNDKAQIGLLFGGKYKLTSETQTQADQEMISSDVAVAGVLTAPAILNADKTEIDGRIYLPTSDLSKNAKQNYQLRADIKLPYSLESQRTATLMVSPRVSDYEITATKVELISQAKLAQGKMFVPYVALNHKLRLDNTAGLVRSEERMGPELGLDINPHRLVRLSLLVAQDRNILNPTKKNIRSEYALFDTKETKYLLGAQIRL